MHLYAPEEAQGQISPGNCYDHQTLMEEKETCAMLEKCPSPANIGNIQHYKTRIHSLF